MPDLKLPPIHTIRGRRVVLDSDLAALYGVTTKVFNQTIRRNVERFPPDFLFQLTKEEVANLKSQSVTSSLEGNRILRSQIVTLETDHRGRHRKYLPWAFTEHGAIMAATILRSPCAVAMSVHAVRAFVRMREALMTSTAIFKRLAEIDKKLLTHDVVLRDIYEKLLPLLAPPPEPPKRHIGFRPGSGRPEGHLISHLSEFDDVSLPISALQHFAFGKRQCALIHIERQWAENMDTDLNRCARLGRSLARGRAD